MPKINDIYTSTGHKFFAHQEAMQNLRNGKGQPVVSHVMLTDVCNHSCAFCSVQHRAGDSLAFDDVMAYLDILLRYGLKAVILSGGGNPILYKCKKTGKNFNDVVDAIHARGLEIGLITNGMPLRNFSYLPTKKGAIYPGMPFDEMDKATTRKSWVSVRPETLDKLTWIRLSMAGLDHDEREVYVPDIDPTKTTLGFSYVAHDVIDEPADKAHGKVSTQADIITLDRSKCKPTWTFEERIGELTNEFAEYAKRYNPRYIRVLPNCLEPHLIERRAKQLDEVAASVNSMIGHEVVFVQNKPPKAPKACYLGYIHPVLNCDGYVYPCDSCVLNDAAGHSFANPWRVCHWSEIAKIYEQPVRSLIADTAKTCPGCVFSRSNEILGGVVDGTADLTPPSETPEHVNFV